MMFWQRLVITARSQSWLARWGLALFFFGLALAFRLAMAKYLTGLPAITFLPAIIGATILCGWRPAVMVVVLSLVSAYFLLPNFGTGADGRLRAFIAIGVYLIVATFEIIIISMLMETVRANRRLAQQEKTLFLELQHRVANTLQFVAAMLTTARQGIVTPAQADEVLTQAVARVTAMGQLHRRMYDAANDDRGFVPLLRDILDEIFKDLDVAVTVQADLARVPLSQMTPIVLLVTEAATNSAKHVFRNGRGSCFEVTLLNKAQERLLLTIRDDGPGMPQAVAPSRGLGLRIMNGLAAQLGGKLVFDEARGAAVSVEFPRN